LGSILLQESGFSLTARKYSGLPAYDLGQVVELINLDPARGVFTPLDSPSFSSNDAAPSSDALAGPISNEGGEIRLCDFRLGKSIKSCQAMIIPAPFAGDK
jgi:hypothetical protein